MVVIKYNLVLWVNILTPNSICFQKLSLNLVMNKYVCHLNALNNFHLKLT